MLSDLNFKDPHAVLPLAAAVLAGSFVSWSVVSYFRSPLRKYPGPFLAGWTNLWRFYQVYTQRYQWTIKALHDKYGPVVRIGPNLLDLDYPELIKTLYGTDGKWDKTEFYHSNSVVVNGKIVYNLFSESDQANHARMKRPVVKFYSLSSVLALERHVDDVLGDLFGHLERRCMEGENKDKDIDLGEWMAFYTWDFISAVTFSKRFGYMDRACDFDGTIAIADKAIDYLALIGQMPFLDHWLDKNPIVRLGPPNLTHVTRVSLGHMAERIQERAAEAAAAAEAGHEKPTREEARDYLDHFLDAKSAYPDVVDDTAVLTYLFINMIAGADTTTTTLRAIFDQLLRSPRVLRRLEAEVRAVPLAPDAVMPYSTARAIPYLEAVVRESMRLHPAVPLPLERYVPDNAGSGPGLTLPDGRYVPPGVAVGINPYVVGRNPSVWGDDPDTFRPERWLQNEDEGEDAATYQRRLRAMNAADLTFGGGSRICIGRNLALLEVYKLVATLVHRYTLQWPEAPYKFRIVSSWFARQTGLVCKLAKREEEKGA